MRHCPTVTLAMFNAGGSRRENVQTEVSRHVNAPPAFANPDYTDFSVGVLKVRQHYREGFNVPFVTMVS